MPNETPQSNKMSRRDLLAAAATSAIVAATPACTTQQQRAPAVQSELTGRDRLKAPLPSPNGLNLIVIVADTWRTDHIGAYGSERIKTPNLDRLASEGVLFEQSYADGLPTIPCRRVWHSGRSLLKEKRGGGGPWTRMM